MNEEKTGSAKAAEKKKEPEAPRELNLTDLVDRTAERISFLKKKQEELQNQKAELEELKRQKKELVEGRREVLKNLERASAVLDSEENELQRKHSLVKATREEFEKIIKEVRSIREESWKEEDLKSELGQALATISKAKRSFTSARGKIEAISSRALDKKESAPSPETVSPEPLPAGPGELFKRGLFFFLPAAILAVLAAVVIRVLFRV